MSSSEVVKNYEMIDGHDYYTATVCDEEKEDCQTLEDFYYVLKNAHPDSQTFPFATTPDKEDVLVPRRIMQDERGVQEFLYENAEKQKCFDVSPQDDYSARVACNVASSGKKEDSELSAKHSSSDEEDTQKKEEENQQGILEIRPWIFAVVIVSLLALTGVFFYFTFST